ncbi:MAG: S41 family peptidase [Candidatus Peribacteraceae bacterium]|nr:S41 family peptidase [Candidatus Peribacteraceae bacterium]
MICSPSRFVRCSSAAVFLCLTLAVPTQSLAKQVASTTSLPANESVSRMEFIRAAVKALKLPTDAGDQRVPADVPVAMKPYIEVAAAHDALGIFGKKPQLTKFITVGQALQVLVKLKDITETMAQESAKYRDVRAGTAESQAVAVAITYNWMSPVSSTLFGTRRVLNGKGAELLLRKASGDIPVRTLPDKLKRAKETTITVNFDSLTVRSSGTLPKSDILEAIWQIVSDEYYKVDAINADDAAYKAAEGIISSLKDPYSSFMRPSSAKSLEQQIKGEVSGIGAQVEQRSGILTIVTPLHGSPAEQAGLLPNDEILSANDVSLSGLDYLEAVDKVRGPKGTSVKLRIRRGGNEFDVTVVRATVTVPEMEISRQGNVMIVKLMQFGQVTEDSLRVEMEKIAATNPKGVVLDLRNNPGGLLDAANTVVSNFVPKGTKVVKIYSRTGTRIDTTKFMPTISSTVPLVVLVNEGSASASEIVAGALQDAGRATVVGKKTFGKGTVQEVLRFSDQSGLKLTVAEWKTPLDRKIDGMGIKPDIEVESLTGRDAQLLKALEILR